MLDASVLLALLDPDDAHHHSASSAVRQLRDDGATWSVPASALAEVLVGVARQGPEHLATRRAAIVAAFGRARVVDEDVAVEAAEVRAAHRTVRLPDALVIATGRADGAEVVLTADRRWAAIDPRVRVVG